ncbi:hypothetical protein [Ammoniphilus sp. YIM 78166]|uniref:hypothetical protein n=1 Tax=Ammoniphilus sp. YIM 78166 TaxID=1644106 RepID=UPI001431E1E8|nr:hypothetical protein [Ammoniphilus sp. YIM 78166]
MIHPGQGTNRGLAVPQTSDPPGSGHEPRACGTSSERSTRVRARTAGLRYLKRAIHPGQGTNRELAVPHPRDPPGSGHEPRACGTSNERSTRVRARTASLRYLIREIHPGQGTNRGLAVPQTSDPPGSGHEPRACGTSSERSTRVRARTAGLRYLIRAVHQVQGTNRGLAVPQTSGPLGSGHEPQARGTSSAPTSWNHYRFESKLIEFYMKIPLERKRKQEIFTGDGGQGAS